MEDKDVKIDRKKHILYSKVIKNIIKNRLSARYSEKDAEIAWEKIQLKYAEYLEDLPYLGGKKCTHNGPGGTYDCIAIFAYYECVEPKPTIEEMYVMNNEAFLPPFQRLGKIANLNKKWQKRVINKVFAITAKKDMKWEKDCPTSYIMRVEPYDESVGIRYRFDRCPIAEFAKAHNLTHIMPAFCNGDYPGIALLKGTLIRKYTCANSDHCDYWIVGNEDPVKDAHPLITDDVGYDRNIDKED